MRRNSLKSFIIAIFIVLNTALPSLAKEDPLKGKVVVIIGASSGFGKGTALKMSKRGAHVVLAARRMNLLTDLQKQCGNDSIAVQTDISKSDEVQHLAEVTLEKFHHIDVWINDVGVGAIGRFDEIPLEDHSRMIDINLKGIIYGSHVAIKQFKKQGYGTLINLGSIDSEVPLAYQGSYSASKAAVLSLGRVLNEELRLAKFKKIHVSTIMPWAVDTPWWDHSANYSGGTARMGSMEGPEKVINAMVKASIHPKEEIAVGWKARSAYHFHKMFPDLSERISANVAHKYQIKEAPPSPNTHGTLFTPMQSGTEIEGGVRERMKLEKSSSTK